MQNAFTQYELEILTKIVDTACKLGCDDNQREAVAMRVVSFAQSGVRDYDALLAIALSERTRTPV